MIAIMFLSSLLKTTTSLIKLEVLVKTQVRDTLARNGLSAWVVGISGKPTHPSSDGVGLIWLFKN